MSAALRNGRVEFSVCCVTEITARVGFESGADSYSFSAFVNDELGYSISLEGTAGELHTFMLTVPEIPSTISFVGEIGVGVTGNIRLEILSVVTGNCTGVVIEGIYTSDDRGGDVPPNNIALFTVRNTSNTTVIIEGYEGPAAVTNASLPATLVPDATVLVTVGESGDLAPDLPGLEFYVTTSRGNSATYVFPAAS